jgi:hypothetical protein
MMTEIDCVRLQAHTSNIGRYKRLLETELSELERNLIERRLSEERSRLSSLAELRASSRNNQPLPLARHTES